MLDCFLKRRAALLSQIEALDKQAKDAPDAETRAEINRRAWLLVARVELYRNTGALAFFDYPQQVENYLDFLHGDFVNGTTEREQSALQEIEYAQALVKDLPPRPLF